MRSKTARGDVLSLSYTWISHKRERQNTLRVMFSNAAGGGERSSHHIFNELLLCYQYLGTQHFVMINWVDKLQLFPFSDRYAVPNIICHRQGLDRLLLGRKLLFSMIYRGSDSIAKSLLLGVRRLSPLQMRVAPYKSPSILHSCTNSQKSITAPFF